ncbi:Rac/Rho-like_protein [Hexamita inflata]|uniref:Rac/Rho-like protein n=1 Tax=Hexamita inflata TaxID=28002 RepID=A0AA86RS96_9EUKA|nr:Rac/Rho-like protein [Hexamita inflata]
MNRYKVVVVGDHAVGKTSLIRVIAGHEFPENPYSIYKYYSWESVQCDQFELLFQDTASQEDYDRVRTLLYNDAFVVLICFALNDHNSFESIFTKWLPEINQYLLNTPIILVGTKFDLQLNQFETNEIQNKIINVSALTNFNVYFLLENVKQIIAEDLKKKNKRKFWK